MQTEDLSTTSWTLGPYLLIKTLGKGGMGEVFLAFDPMCKRMVAIKKIRDELLDKPNIHERFLREARIASQLTHPAIIPIFSIHSDSSMSYYTMPYVEGKTLKEILQGCRQKLHNGYPLAQEESLPSLLNLFLKICEAIGYSHSKGVLHRDLKPDNVIVGKFGEVLLLDWGIAKKIDEGEKEDEICEFSQNSALTKPGKIAGTITYLAPERAFGKPSSFQTDIYALGVMLFQILTLTSPFRRTTLAELRKKAHSEQVPDPKERSPYRDISQPLSEMVFKSLAFPPEKRYQKVEELTRDLKNFIEGRASWLFTAQLDIAKEDDWQLHENILPAQYLALTRSAESAVWASLMVSKASFSPNIKIEAEIEITQKSEGVGILFGIPEEDRRKELEEGYCLWCGSEKGSSSFLLRSQILVKEIPEIVLSLKKKHLLSIECMEGKIRIFFDGCLVSSLHTIFPLAGSHVGILYKDREFSLRHLKVYAASQPLKIRCLAIPDAFFLKGHFEIAYSEYRQIAHSFAGRKEAREAIFRSGLSLLESAKETKSKRKRSLLYKRAFDEFDQLQSTQDAPLKYFGDSLTYAALQDVGEEAKCLELAIRKFARHPKLSLLQEHLSFRCHESSLKERKTAYRLILIALQHIPQFAESREAKKLLYSLQNNWEDFFFFTPLSSEETFLKEPLMTRLAFHLAKKETIFELIDSLMQSQEKAPFIEDALFGLIELGAIQEVHTLIPSLFSLFPKHDWSSLSQCVDFHRPDARFSLPSFFAPGWHQKKEAKRTAFHIIQEMLSRQQPDSLSFLFSSLSSTELPPSERLFFDSLHIWYLLLQKEWEQAKEVFLSYSPTILNDENAPLHSLYGIWLYCREGKEAATLHFAKVLDTPYPRSTSLLSHFLLKKISLKKWGKEAFFWEKRLLFRHLALFYHSIGDEANSSYFLRQSRASP